MKKRYIYVGMAALLLSFNSMIVSASVVEENQIPYSEIRFNTEQVRGSAPEAAIESLTVSDTDVTIEYSGESVFVDAIAILANSDNIYVSDIVKWESSTDAVSVYNGRIIANKAGSSTVTVSYGEHTAQIHVRVLKNDDIAGKVQTLNGSLYNNKKLRVADDQIVNVARDMVEYQWTPTAYVRSWRDISDDNFFVAGRTYSGIPYSQTVHQVNKNLFASALSTSDFYSNYSRTLDGETIIMPKYGNDCSGFVSFAWGIAKKGTSNFIAGIRNGTYSKVGSYNANSPTTAELKEAYKSLQPGNAVVKSGHTFLIAANDAANSKVYVYEQTPPKARYTTWTYQEMADAKYMPFAK